MTNPLHGLLLAPNIGLKSVVKKHEVAMQATPTDTFDDLMLS